MASPPFNIAETLPGDSDIVSQHPFNARAFRDTVESWLLINHDTNGAHKFVDTPWAASPAAPAASINRIFATATGALKMIINGGTEMFVGVPPGTVAHTASSVVPNGWLLADFSAVSRSTFADLFAAIGTTHGVGDGSTTFNIPNGKGAVIAGSGDLTKLPGGTFSAIIGAPTITLSVINLPPYTPVGSVSVTSTATDVLSGGTVATFSGAPGANLRRDIVASSITSTGTLTGTAQGGTSTPFSIVQTTLVLTPIIKY